MISRCSSGYGTVRPSYSNCSVAVPFEDKQYFLNWWNVQPFAGARDDLGRSYHLDKDVIVPGNTVYGPETCVFIPAAINSFYSFLDSSFNDSVGAIKNTRNNKWAAEIKLWPLPRKKHLGSTFECKEEAHAAYCTAKDTHARHMALYFQDKVDGKVIHALNNFSTREQIEAYAKHRL